MNAWSWYWVNWLLLGFGVPEGYALANNVRNTLSYQVWDAEQLGGTPVRVIVFAACLWLLVHMTFQWIR